VRNSLILAHSSSYTHPWTGVGVGKSFRSPRMCLLNQKYSKKQWHCEI